MKNTLRFLVCVCLFCMTGILQAQTAAESYQQKAGNFALVFNGTIEKGYRLGYVNTPYYPQEYTAGSFAYRGVTYNNVLLRIDSRTGRLLTQSPDGKFNLVIHPEEIGRAVIGGVPFVYFKSSEATPGEGYYAALYEGKDFCIYKQHYVSNINKEFQGSVQLQKFSMKDRFFLLKDGKWNLLSGKSSFIKHFKQHKNALNDYCKQHKLTPGKKNEADWHKLAVYCETLIK